MARFIAAVCFLLVSQVFGGAGLSICTAESNDTTFLANESESTKKHVAQSKEPSYHYQVELSRESERIISFWEGLVPDAVLKRIEQVLRFSDHGGKGKCFLHGDDDCKQCMGFVYPLRHNATCSVHCWRCRSSTLKLAPLLGGS